MRLGLFRTHTFVSLECLAKDVHGQGFLFTGSTPSRSFAWAWADAAPLQGTKRLRVVPRHNGLTGGYSECPLRRRPREWLETRLRPLTDLAQWLRQWPCVVPCLGHRCCGPRQGNAVVRASFPIERTRFDSRVVVIGLACCETFDRRIDFN